jgi:phenol hydroxylase P4 protein
LALSLRACRSRREFHGNQLLTLLWDDHLMFAAPIVVPVPLSMPWSAVAGEVLPQLYAQHPDWAKVDMGEVEWTLDGEPFEPDAARSLAEQGVHHKSVIRFRTPGLVGLAGAHF